MVQLYNPYHLLHQFLPCTQSRPRSLLVTPVHPLSLHQLVKHSAGHSSTCSNGRSFLLSIGFHPRSSFLGPFIRHSLGSYHWSSFLVPNLEPVLCLSHLSTPSHWTNCWNILLVNMFKWSQLFAFNWVSSPKLVFGPFYQGLRWQKMQKELFSAAEIWWTLAWCSR